MFNPFVLNLVWCGQEFALFRFDLINWCFWILAHGLHGQWHKIHQVYFDRGKPALLWLLSKTSHFSLHRFFFGSLVDCDVYF